MGMGKSVERQCSIGDLIMKEKICAKCNKVKFISAHSTVCKDCQQKKIKKMQQKEPEPTFDPFNGKALY